MKWLKLPTLKGAIIINASRILEDRPSTNLIADPTACIVLASFVATGAPFGADVIATSATFSMVEGALITLSSTREAFIDLTKPTPTETT